MTAARAFLGIVLAVLAVGLPIADSFGGPTALRLVPAAAAFAGIIGVHRRIEARSRVVLASAGSAMLLFLPLAMLAPWSVMTGPLLLLAAAVVPTTAERHRGADLAALVPLTALFALVVCGSAMALA